MGFAQRQRVRRLHQPAHHRRERHEVCGLAPEGGVFVRVLEHVEHCRARPGGDFRHRVALPDGSLAGTLVTVFFDGTILESWPARFSGVTALDFSTEDFDDRCTLYLAVLEDLWPLKI